MGVDNRPGSFYNSNAPSWANTGNTQVDDEEEEQGGGGGIAGVTAPALDPWGITVESLPTSTDNPMLIMAGDKPAEDFNPTPEPTPTQPTGGSGTPWYLYKGYGEPTSVQYGFSNTTGYAPGYAPLYNKPTDWRLQGSGVDVARKNDNSPMPQPTKWNAPVTPPPSVTSIPNLPITPQEVNNLKPVVENWKTQNLVYTPEMGNVADTYAFQNQRTRASEPAPFYRDAGANIYRSGPAREPEAQKKYVYDPTKKKPNAFGGGGRGGGGGGGGSNWKAALDTINWNI